MSDDPEAVYRARADQAGRRAVGLGAVLTRLVHLRLLSFLGAAILAGVAVWRGWPALAIAAGVALAAFAVLVAWHGRVARRHRRAVIQGQVNQEALLRLARDWDALPHRPRRQPAVAPEHPYAADLDVTGRASLLHLLDTTTTPTGAETLARWLLAPADPDAVRLRQAAVAELAPLLDVREELQVLGRVRAGDDPDPEPFLRWAESGRLPRAWPAMLAWAWAGPIIALALAGLWVAHVVTIPLWILAFALNGAVGLLLGVRVEAVLAPVRSHQGALAAYAGQLDVLTAARLEAGRLLELQEAASAGGLPAARQLRRLDSIVGFAVPPASAQYLLFQSLFLWNVHVLAFLERWRSRAGHRARGWTAALGELEALAALAGLAHAHPAWTFPELDAGADRLEATALGHPLIAPAARVDNDVTVGPPGEVLLVTGSNMSGKSTLLRAIGTNAVLAAAGGPACAARLRLPPLRVWTSMRIADSLERGVSHFLAELRRLQQVVEAAEAATAAGGPAVCHLLDEVLQGTNTAERQVAARAILAHLAGCRAIGAVSTHDLTLADDEQTSRLVRHVHFQETITSVGGRPAMTFDYRLRPGPATSTNALLLMELIGLSVPGATPRPAARST